MYVWNKKFMCNRFSHFPETFKGDLGPSQLPVELILDSLPAGKAAGA